VSNYYETSSRTAGVAWAAGFGRLGGIAGPLVGGLLLAAALDIKWIFITFAGVALLGAVITALVPAAHRSRRAIPIEPTAVSDAAPA
jgi:MFS transporter, AAHS family, benzoate transport protein